MSAPLSRRRIISRVKHDRERESAAQRQRNGAAKRRRESTAAECQRNEQTGKQVTGADRESSSVAEQHQQRTRKRPMGAEMPSMRAELCRQATETNSVFGQRTGKRESEQHAKRIERLESGLQSAMKNTCAERSVYAYNYVPKGAGDGGGDQAAIDWRRDDIDVQDEWFVPRSLDDVVDNRRSIEALDRWLALWSAKPLILPRQCAAFVRGPPGVGKTTAVRLALQKHGFTRVIEINGSDQRSKTMVDRLRSLIMQSSVDGVFGRTAIVIEEVDGLHVGSGGASLSSATRARSASRSKTSANASASSRVGESMLDARSAAAGEVAAPHEEADDAAHELSSQAGGTIGASGGGGSSGSDALLKFLKSSGIRPKRCDRRGLHASSAAAVGDETWSDFRSTVPIILLANDSSAAFMKKLCELTMLLRFWPLDERQVRYRIVNQLSVALNVKWSRPKSQGLYQNLPLYDVLVAHSAGDLRKATSLMAGAVRAAYSRRRDLPPDHSERRESFLLVRRADCVAFFGESKEDVMDSVPTLFGAARFLLCQMRCRCEPAQHCSCTERRTDTTASPRSRALHEQTPAFVAPRRATVFEQAQRMAAHDIRVLPHMLFENAHRCAAEPRRCQDIESRLAASRVRCAMADWFALADVVRADTHFLRDRRLQEFYMQFGMVAPSLIVRYPERYVRMAPESVERPVAIERAHGGARINLQKSSLDGENGNGAHTLSLAKDERNAYVRHFNLPYQVDLARWYDSDNYVSKVDETRAQKKMLCQDTRKRGKRKERTDDDLIVTKSKLTKAEVTRLRNEMRSEQKRQLQQESETRAKEDGAQQRSTVASSEKQRATAGDSFASSASERLQTLKRDSADKFSIACDNTASNQRPLRRRKVKATF